MKKITKPKNTSGRGQRDLKVKVKSARGKTVSQVKWLQRQLNDPYVKRAQLEGFRGRAAFKILELNEKYNFCLLYTSPSPRDNTGSRMPSSA